MKSLANLRLPSSSAALEEHDLNPGTPGNYSRFLFGSHSLLRVSLPVPALPLRRPGKTRGGSGPNSSSQKLRDLEQIR